MKHFFIFFLILFQLKILAQTNATKYNFSKKITEVTGDLNKDNLPDKVIVTQDIIHEDAPYRLQIFFIQPNGQFKLIVTSINIIEPQYPHGRNGYYSGNSFNELTIKKGVLTINFGLIRGYIEHKFRYQNGNFELIGFHKVYSDGLSEMQTTDFNLSTGIRIEKTERYDDSEGITSNTEKKIRIRPLPKLQDVIPFENQLY
jgi:hypothetical protein